MAIEHLHIPAELVPAALTLEELEAGDLYEHLRDHRRIHVREAIERLTLDTSGRPVEYVHSVYRGDRYRIVSRLDFTQDGVVTSSTEGDAY